MFKLMYIPKQYRGFDYGTMIEQQVNCLQVLQGRAQDKLQEIDKVMLQAQSVHKKNCEIQSNLLKTLGNLNKCSKEELKELQLLTENYMKLAINKGE